MTSQGSGWFGFNKMWEQRVERVKIYQNMCDIIFE